MHNNLPMGVRNRLLYGSLTAVVMLAGFLSRRLLGHYVFIRVYAGDVLWAMMVFFGFAFVFRKWPTRKVAAVALCFSVCIELSQIYHAPWIDAIRQVPLGGLILGFTFVWSDLVCYSVGVGIGAMMEVCFLSAKYKNDF
jgi:glycopeptide antibiotics resistance protein